MTATVTRVSKVEQHPDAPHLDMVYFEKFPGVVSMKLEDGSPRYYAGDFVVYVAEGSIVPDYLLRQGFWNEDENKGLLAGPKGNRVKASNFRGVRSHGILFPLEQVVFGLDEDFQDVFTIKDEAGVNHRFTKDNLGDDISEILGITG